MAEYLAQRDGGKTDEHGFSRFISNLLTGAVISTGWSVSQRGAGPNMSVDIAAGDGKIDTGSGYGYLAWSDAVKNVAITTADATNPRNDIVVAYIDKAVVSSTNSNNPNALKMIVVAGTPAASPADPSAGTIQTAVGAGNPYIQLARVRVNAAASSITNSNITDLRSLVAGNFNVGGSDGWIAANEVWTYLQNNGQKEQLVTISGDKTTKYSKGMRVKLARSTAPPTQCTDLELSSSQYANDTTISGLSFTDDFTAEAWIKLESYGTVMGIISRYNGTSGFQFRIEADGRVLIVGLNGGAANYRQIVSYQSVPIGRWVHVAAKLDMSASAGNIYINGVDVPAVFGQGGTNPTALVQAGDLNLGAINSGSFFDGKIADARLWNALRTTTQIRENMNQQLVGTETNLVGYWKLNGNFNDSTTSANNLTAQGSAVATNSDNPMNSTEMALIHDVSYSSGTGLTTLTLFTGMDYNIPNMTLNTPYYSLQEVPYGFPSDFTKWRAETWFTSDLVTGFGGLNTWHTAQAWLYVPVGSWAVGYDGNFSQESTVSGTRDLGIVFAERVPTNAARAESDLGQLTAYLYEQGTSAVIMPVKREARKDLTVQTVFKLYGQIYASTGAEDYRVKGGSGGYTVFYAQSAYA